MDLIKASRKKLRNKREVINIESILHDYLGLKRMPIKVTIMYALIGGIWILFSDRIFNIFIESKSLLVRIQTFKEWVYVLITSFIIYFFLSEFTKKSNAWSHKLKENFEEMQATYDQLMALEGQLMSQYDELNEKQAIIEKSEERYKLALKGANDAIWEINKLKYYDILTDIPNRKLFTNTLENEIINAKDKQVKVAALFIDLDDFKEINDTLGHDYGDELLKNVAISFKDFIKEGDFVSRVGGDEFFILMKNIEDYSEIGCFCERLQSLLNCEISVDNKHVYASASIGITVFPDDGDEMSILFKNADTAMYSAKYNGKAKYSFFNKGMSDVVVRHVEIEKGLRNALKNNELEIHYQPQIDIINNKIKGFEALLRWDSPELGIISPAEFIPVAEQSGLIIDIGDWLIKTVCLQNNLWKSKGYLYDTIAINLSAIQLENDKFEETLKSIITQTKINPRFVELEITESILVKDFDKSVKSLTEIRNLGIKVALDDFGTGYSSLSYLKQLPINTLKIDKSFIDNIVTNEREKSIVDGIVQLAQKIDLEVIAEGAENKEQIKLLKSMGCNQIQGYYFSKPLPADEIEEKFLKTNWIAPSQKRIKPMNKVC